MILEYKREKKQEKKEEKKNCQAAQTYTPEVLLGFGTGYVTKSNFELDTRKEDSFLHQGFIANSIWKKENPCELMGLCSRECCSSFDTKFTF